MELDMIKACRPTATIYLLKKRRKIGISGMGPHTQHWYPNLDGMALTYVTRNEIVFKIGLLSLMIGQMATVLYHSCFFLNVY